MSQRFTYSIPPHTLPFPATASHICVAEPRPHAMPFPATADRICVVAPSTHIRRFSVPCPVQPLKGLRGTCADTVFYRAVVPAGHGGRGATLSYRALSPDGESLSFPIEGNPSVTPTIVHCSFYIVHCFTFSAKERDPETGLSYFGSRYYSGDLSIWLSVDPMSDKYPSLSPYTYCANNPVKLVDPNGEFPMSMHAQMVSNVFKNSSLSSGVIKKVKFGASVIADGLNVFTSFVHMDNMAGTSSIVSLYNAAKSAFTTQMREENYVVAGVALHTVADFYSHSNYIDLYSEYADKNGLSMDIDDIPTFSDAMNDKKFMKFVEKSGGLKTGIFPGKGERSHKEMNMDSNDSSNGGSPYNEKNPTGPTKHEAARRVAQKELNNMVKEYEK